MELPNYLAIVLSFVLISTDNWLFFCMMSFALFLFINWVVWNTKSIN